MNRFVIHVPRWLRWGLLVVLSLLVVSFTTVFFMGIGRADYGSWVQPAVSVVQIALAALAYITLLFFTESAQSPAALRRTADHLLVRQLPDALGRIADHRGQLARVEVGARSGIVGHAYHLHFPDAAMRFWVGLNVNRLIFAVFIAPPGDEAEEAFEARVRRVFRPTLEGAREVGYGEPKLQFATHEGVRLLSLWLTWDLSAKASHAEQDFLTHAPMQLFLVQDLALMVQSFVRTAQREGVQLSTPIEPMPL
jgi:hypothetical protein